MFGASVAASPTSRESQLLPDVALLPGEAAGRISTSNAGAISLSATLTVRPGENLPPVFDLTGLVSAPGVRFLPLTEGPDSDADAPGQFSYVWKISAFDGEQLTGALDAALRSLTTLAALTEAVFEARAVRLVDPFVPSAAIVEALALRLLRAGLSVSFGPSWTPLPPGAGISVGSRGLEGVFAGFLASNLASRRLPRQEGTPPALRAPLDRRLPSG